MNMCEREGEEKIYLEHESNSYLLKPLKERGKYIFNLLSAI